MKILLDDLPFNDSLYPFGAIKSMVHIRFGILTIYEKWQLIFPGEVLVLSEYGDHLPEPGTYIRMPANQVPSAEFFKSAAGTLSCEANLGNCKILDDPRHIFEHNQWAILQDFALITANRKSAELSATNHWIHPENI